MNTRKVINEYIKSCNRMLNLAPGRNIILVKSASGYAIERLCNDDGGTIELAACMEAREAYFFARGMCNALEQQKQLAQWGKT